MEFNKAIDEFINEKLIENLLFAHKKIAEKGMVKPLIMLTKFIFRLSKQFDNEVMYFSIKEVDDNSKKPPKEC